MILNQDVQLKIEQFVVNAFLKKGAKEWILVEESTQTVQFSHLGHVKEMVELCKNGAA